MKTILLLFLLSVFGGNSFGEESSREIAARKAFMGIKSKSFSREYLDNVMLDPRMKFNVALIDSIKAMRKRRSGFGFLFDSVSIARGKDFLRSCDYLDSVFRKYRVHPEITTAIFRIESDLGLNVGEFCAPTTYFTLYIHFPKYRKFALREMKVFLEWCRKETIDPFSVRSSWMGALFLTQFIPSSLRFGVDGDKDGVINLLSFTDALLSIGNYLEKSGYARSQKEAVFRYNRSKAYVNAVFKYAKLIKE